eukprot:gene17832-24215_t
MGEPRDPMQLRGDKKLQQQRGRYNPVTNEYIEPVDPSYGAAQKKVFDRNTGQRHKGAVHNNASRQSEVHLAWDQFLSPQDYQNVQQKEVLESPTVQHPSQHPSQEGHRPGWVGTLGVAEGGDKIAPPAPGLAGAAAPTFGSSWGAYDPISHTWKVAPSNAKFVNQQDNLERKLGITSARRQPEGQPSHGIYNPILNTWTIPPTDPREAAGLAFQPAGIFTKVYPTTIRS